MMFSRAAVATFVVLISACLAKKTDLNQVLDSGDLTDMNAAIALFNSWKETHQISFQTSQDESKAFDTLLMNAMKIKQHRSEHSMGKHTYTVGLNQFSHLTYDEFRSSRLGYSKYTGRSTNNGAYRQKRATPPASLNYTAMGYVTPVKDQGDCGCCWTFSTTGALEGAYFKKTGKLLNFSEQQLVECVPVYAGCDGGVCSEAINYIKSFGGIASQANYPYTSADTSFGACKVSGKPVTSMAPVYQDINQDDTSLMNALVTYGPLSVAVAVGDPFMSYQSGIMDPTSACTPPINHAVLLVGYGTDPTTKLNYWLLKNSWSTTWGEKGFFRLRRDIPDSCGVNEDSISVIVP